MTPIFVFFCCMGSIIDLYNLFGPILAVLTSETLFKSLTIIELQVMTHNTEKVSSSSSFASLFNCCNLLFSEFNLQQPHQPQWKSQLDCTVGEFMHQMVNDKCIKSLTISYKINKGELSLVSGGKLTQYHVCLKYKGNI